VRITKLTIRSCELQRSSVSFTYIQDHKVPIIIRVGLIVLLGGSFFCILCRRGSRRGRLLTSHWSLLPGSSTSSSATQGREKGGEGHGFLASLLYKTRCSSIDSVDFMIIANSFVTNYTTLKSSSHGNRFALSSNKQHVLMDVLPHDAPSTRLARREWGVGERDRGSGVVKVGAKPFLFFLLLFSLKRELKSNACVSCARPPGNAKMCVCVCGYSRIYNEQTN
jgi:hypothetical protein